MSHSTADRAWVDWLSRDIRRIGVLPYMCEHDPQPGRCLSEKIQQQIQASDAVIVFLTQTSQLSPYVQQEIGYAEAAKKLVIPIVQTGLDRNCLAMLDGREYISLDFKNPLAMTQSLTQRLLLLSAAKQLQQTQQQNAILLLFGAAVVVALLSEQ